MVTNKVDADVIPFRRVVPAGYQKATLSLTGLAPLLMNSGEADRDSDTYRTYFNLGKVRGKTLEQEAQLRRLEWSLALYLDAELGPFIPSQNLHEMLRQAATKWKKGADIGRSLVVMEYRIPLVYDGPRTEEALWDGGFRDHRMVANGGIGRGRVVRCRPKFEAWSLEATLAFDPEDLDFDLLQMVVDRTEKYGLGDYRTGGFGAFAAVLSDAEEHNGAVNTNGAGTKAKHPSEQAAHGARVKRIVKEASA